MPNELPQRLRELAQFQHGILTRDQAQQGGLTKDVIRSRVRQDRWQRMHAGVYAVFSGEPGRTAVLWAAVFRAGPGAMLSHHTAAELAGLTDAPSTSIHVTIPASRRIAGSPGLVVHVSSRADQIPLGDPYECCPNYPEGLAPRTTRIVRVSGAAEGETGRRTPVAGAASRTLAAAGWGAAGWARRAGCGRLGP